VRARITAGAIVVVALAFGIGAVGTVWALDRILNEQVAAQLESELETVADMLEEGGSATAWIEERDDVLIALHAEGGVIVNDDDALQLPLPADGDAPLRARADGESVLVVGEEVDGGMLVLGRSTETISEAVSTASALLAVAVPLAVALVGGVVWIVAARALAPVERIRRQVDRVDAGALDRRVPTTGTGDEIDRLAGTMNRMLERIEHGSRARQRFVSDASHELRSPLATMRQYAEVDRAHPGVSPPGELAEVVLAEGGRMQEIVEAMLLLARLDESGGSVATTGVDLDDLALEEARRVRAMGAASVDGRGIAPVRVVGDPRLLARAVRNLVDNAVRHARGTIAIATEVQGGWGFVHVDDDGAGVPEAERERVFERFTRLDEARSRDAGGSGLGLAIVSEVARAHGGSVRVVTAPLGGARFTLALPVAPDEG